MSTLILFRHGLLVLCGGMLGIPSFGSASQCIFIQIEKKAFGESCCQQNCHAICTANLCIISILWLEIMREISIFTVRLCGGFISVSGPVKDFAVKIDFSAPVPLSSDWSVFERQEAITMHVA